MLEFHKYKKLYIDNIYSTNVINDDVITIDYKLFSSEVERTENIVFSILNEKGLNLPNDPISEMVNSDMGNEYELILMDSAMRYLEDVYGKKRLDTSGMCLISNLIGKACQMIHDEDLLGIVRGFDENKPRLLHIDFGDPEEVKVDIDELIIQGQKKS